MVLSAVKPEILLLRGCSLRFAWILRDRCAQDDRPAGVFFFVVIPRSGFGDEESRFGFQADSTRDPSAKKPASG